MNLFGKEITLEKIRFHLGKLYVEKFEQIPYVNWFNPLITIYLNFRSFPLCQAWKFPVFVYGWPRLFSLYGTMECVGKCWPGMIVLNQTNCGMPNNPGTSTAIDNWGKIIFHGKCQIFTSNKINVGLKATLELGEGTKIMCMCNITAYTSVRIGAQSWIVHRCQVMDSNFHFVANFRNKIIPRYSRPIEIGSYCWICNSTTVSAGAKIPNKTIVASNSLVNKDMQNIPEESIIGGIPAKLISTGFRKVESKKLERAIWKYFAEHPNEILFPLEENVSSDICDVDE